MEEEYTNGKLEETKKEEVHEEEKEVVIEGVDESLKENVGDANAVVDVKETSSSSSSSSDEESPDSLLDEKSVEVVNLEKLEDEKSIEPLVPLPEESTLIPDAEVLVENIDVSDVTELESNEIKEQILPSLDENNEVSAVVTNVILEEPVETLMSVSDGCVGESLDIAKLASKENVDASELQLDENDVNSSGVVDLESKENVDNLLQMPADVPSVVIAKMDERNVEVEIPERMINQPVISLAPRARHMTSWRSCCGLFDVLRRSDR